MHINSQRELPASLSQSPRTRLAKKWTESRHVQVPKKGDKPKSPKALKRPN